MSRPSDSAPNRAENVPTEDLPAELRLPYEVVFLGESTPHPPRVTVVVSLYNYERYILECLESVRVQSVADLDLIVVNDCSRDGSVETTRRWLGAHRHRFRKCQLIRHGVNRGLAASRNIAFRKAETDYVFVLDADNMIYPRCLEVLSSALDQCDASFAYGYLEKFGAERGILSCRPWDSRILEVGNYIDAMCMIRKSAWEQAGGYSTDMVVPGWEDFEFWLKLSESGGWGVLVPEFLARYRVHFSSMLRTNTNLQITLLWDYLERMHPQVRRPPHVSESWYRDQDEVLAECERIRCVRGPSGLCSLEVRGWALARSGMAQVDLLIGDRPVGQARYGDLRSDLAGRAEGYPNGDRCGFSSHVALILPGEDGAEDHFLTLRATASSGKVFEHQHAFKVLDRSADDLPDSEWNLKEHRLLV